MNRIIKLKELIKLDKAKQEGQDQDGQGQEGQDQDGQGRPGQGQEGQDQDGQGQPGQGQPGQGQQGQGQPGQGQPGQGQPGQGQPGQGQPGQGQPGQGGLTSGEKDLDGNFIKEIEDALNSGEGPEGTWNIGESDIIDIAIIDGQPGQGQPGQGRPGQGNENDRIWTDPETARKIDEINRKIARGLPTDPITTSKGGKKKAKGSGDGGSLRDRILMEEIASVDWGQIFKKRLSAYSNELSKWKPWDKRYAGNPMLRTRIPSRIPPKDTLPETNIAIDTSISMSYTELAVILKELQAALQEAKIKKLNVILWHTRAYWTGTYTSVTKNDFAKIDEDIQKNWQGGGTEVVSAYKKIIEKKWKNKFTIIFTDGYVESHGSGSEAMNLATEALDINNLIWGIIKPSTGISYSQWESITENLPGEKIGIFLDTNLFNKNR